MAKMVNFGLAYGMSDFGLSSRAGISRQDAQEFINSLLRGVRRDQPLHAPHPRDGGEQGYVSTLLGRKRQIPELRSANRAAQGRRRADGDQHADPGHGRGHHEDRDDPHRPRAARRRVPGAGRAAPVHDELLIEAPRDEVDRLIPVLREAMEGALPLSVPLTVEVEGRRLVGGDEPRLAPGCGAGGGGRGARRARGAA